MGTGLSVNNQMNEKGSKKGLNIYYEVLQKNMIEKE